MFDIDLLAGYDDIKALLGRIAERDSVKRVAAEQAG